MMKKGNVGSVNKGSALGDGDSLICVIMFRCWPSFPQ